MNTLPGLYKLPPNRVWRTYLGGSILDSLSGKNNPTDSHFPEDWIGSVTEASNPPGTGGSNGLSVVQAEGRPYVLRELIAANPAAFLGQAHVDAYGTDARLLIKFIDASIRLHLQVHPTAEFAQKHFGVPSGKTEAYCVLASRPEIADPHLYLGFHSLPERNQLKAWIESQDIDSLLQCMNRVTVAPGGVILVPGGTPHALGEGLFLVELQEPSDLVVRFEFERGGYVLPEDSRFMGRGLDFCLDVFDTTPCTAETIEHTLRCHPKTLRTLTENARESILIGPEQTNRFRLNQVAFHGPCTLPVSEFTIAIVTEGACQIESASQSLTFDTYEKCLIPSTIERVRLIPRDDSGCSLLLCKPPLPA